MRLFKKIKIEKVTEKENNIVYCIGAFERGIATTIGNSMRRVLLSSIPGYATYAIKVKGADHEFVNMPNVDIDLPSIILNIKEIIFSVNKKIFNEETKNISLTLKSKKGVVTAKNIECPSGVKVLNPNFIIAHTEKDNALEFELLLREDRGYESFSITNEYLDEKGYIAIDAIYSPIKNVTFKVNELTIHKILEEEELILDVTTDGSITCDEAVSYAAQILTSHLGIFISDNEKGDDNNIMATKFEKKYSHTLNLSIEYLNLNIRTYNSLRRAGIKTIKDIVTKNRKDLEKMRNFGDRAFENLKQALKEKKIDFLNL